MNDKPGRGNRTERRGHRSRLADEDRATVLIRVTKATHAALLERRQPKETINDVIERLLDERGKTVKTFRYERINADQVTSTDLREEAMNGAEAYRVTIYRADGTQEAEHAEAVYADGRLGIAWGADATWADVKDVESGIEMWLNDGDAWEAAN